jgi:hypothetical protein
LIGRDLPARSRSRSWRRRHFNEGIEQFPDSEIIESATEKNRRLASAHKVAHFQGTGCPFQQCHILAQFIGLAAEADLLAIVLYDAHGEAIYESAPVPENLSPRIKLMLESRDEIALDLHGEEAGGNLSYLVGVRRKNVKGMIVLVLGDEGLQYWASRVAIQEAVEDGGWRKGVHYFAVVDSRGRLLAGAGDLPEGDAGKEMHSKGGENPLQRGRLSRRVI